MEFGNARRRVLMAFTLALGLTTIGLQQSWIRFPAAWWPWAEVDLESVPGRMARFQLNALSADPDACFGALDRSGLLYTALAERPVQNGCGLVDGVRFEQSHVPYSSGFDLSCTMAAALYWYEAELDLLAQEHLGSDLARINHLGSYACRNINNSTAGRRSQHATANALDVSGFVLADGREITLLAHWGGEGPEADFLAAAHKSACGLFNTVLGPDYNALHADHFHLDMGRLRACR